MKTMKKILALSLALMLLCSVLLLPAMATEPLTEPPAVEEEANAGLEFHPEGFVDSLQYMGTGMIGIFLVIGIIVLVTLLLNKIFSSPQKNKN